MADITVVTVTLAMGTEAKAQAQAMEAQAMEAQEMEAQAMEAQETAATVTTDHGTDIPSPQSVFTVCIHSLYSQFVFSIGLYD